MESTQETDDLQGLAARIATRQSITHFAMAAVSSMLAIITFGISLRLAIDVGDPLVFGPVGALFLCCLGVAFFGLFRGRQLRATEHADYSRYLELRAKAGLD